MVTLPKVKKAQRKNQSNGEKMTPDTGNKSLSATYKFRAPGISDHAGYFVIVGNPNIKGFFLNSKEMSNFQWITALMTSYSRQIEAGIPIKNIINDMKETFQPDSGYIIPDGTDRRVHSVVHHLGLILEKHVQSLVGGLIK